MSALCRAPSTSTICAAAEQALAGNPLFARTELIDDADEFARRLPLMAANRDLSEPDRAQLGR